MLSWIVRLFKAFGMFITQASKKPIWRVTTAVIVFFFPLLFVYLSTLPDEIAKLEEYNHKRKVLNDEVDRIHEITSQELDISDKVKENFKQFKSLIHDIADSHLRDNRQQEIENIRNSAVESKKQLELMVANLKGVQLREPVLDEYIRRQEVFLTLKVNYLKTIENFCNSYLVGDIEKYSQGLQQALDKTITLNQEAETISSQMQSFDEKLKSTKKSLSIEEERIKAKRDIIYYVELLKYFFIVFLVIYVGCISIGVGKQMKKPERVISRSKKVISKPRKRRKR